MTLTLLADALVCALLLVTIVLGAVFARRLARLRDAQIDLAGLGEGFAAATAKAEAGLRELRQTAEAEGTALQRRIDRIEGLKDDLMFLIEKADSAAERLERALGAARQIGPAKLRAAPPARQGRQGRPERPERQDSPAAAAAGAEAQGRGAALSRAGQELLRTLQGVR
jgi:malonyl CoA-acyl carrier protein transacylase